MKGYFRSLVVCAIAAVAIVCANSSARATDDPGSSASSSSAKVVYLVVYRPGPAWPQGKPISALPLREHGKYMVKLYKDGVSQFAGPFADDSGGAVVFQAEDDAGAKRIVEADPAVTSGIFRYELHPWKLALGKELGGR